MAEHRVRKSRGHGRDKRRIFHWDRYEVGDRIRIGFRRVGDRRKVQAAVMQAVIQKRKGGMTARFKSKGCHHHILLIRLPDATI